jgi:hypothetical protein
MNAMRGRLVLLTFVMVLVTACGGAAGGGGDPSSAVKAAFDAAGSGGLAKLDDFACAAEKGKVSEMFGSAAGMEQLTAAGVDPNQVMSAIAIKFDNLTTKESSRTDKDATVHVNGNMTVTVDPAKFKPILKTILQAQGLPSDDATIDAALTAMSGSLSKSQAIDEDVKLVNENGKWLICG